NLLNIKIKERYWPIGVVADHNPILNHGFKATLMDCLTLGGGVHTSKDDMSKVSAEKLEEAGKLAQKVVEVIDEDFN
ncbi:MAG: hypothetical protein ACTSVY_11665, partial [Candidatus Helarchaeota archaeon]